MQLATNTNTTTPSSSNSSAAQHTDTPNRYSTMVTGSSCRNENALRSTDPRQLWPHQRHR